MTTLVTTVTGTLRYRGKLGQWSWMLHRITGLGTALFLILHVIDTSWAAFYPDQYAQVIREYQSPLFTIGEFALIVCVVYHAFNGLRIVLLDYKPVWWAYQQRAATLVFLATILVLTPTFVLMAGHVADFYGGDQNVAGLDEIIDTQAKFAGGFVVIVVAALALSALYGLITRDDHGFELPGRLEATLWSYMRVSGVLVLLLVFGHLAMMHVIQGVFEITGSGIKVVGTDTVNQTGKAVEFVGARWNMLLAGVAIWRVFDGLLLALVVIHGLNGVRYVVNDYAHPPLINRALNWAIVFGMVALIVLGTAALLAGVDKTAYDIARNMTSGN
jgi:succinate dehydrogenase cytochrome b556 subunit